MSFSFPTKNKRPPLDRINFVVWTIRTQIKAVSFVRLDTGGELARSAEGNYLLIKL